MRRRPGFPRILTAALLFAIAGHPAAATAQQPERLTAASWQTSAFPLELVSAQKAERIAWLSYQDGRRNAYTAAAPSFAPVRVTRFLDDDGTEISNIRISDDGSMIVFVRGAAPNSDGWVTNPMHDPDGAERAIWAARTANPGVSWRIAEGTSPELSPDGRHVLYTRDGQIYRARTAPATAASPLTEFDRGEKPFIVAWGTNSSPRWSPDGARIAFVSNRGTHSFVALYDVPTRTVTYVAPSVDRDASPTWSPDGKRIAFTRRPGLPFGQQNLVDNGGVQGGRAGRVGGGGGRGGRGGFGDQPTPASTARNTPGLFRATFPGGYTLSFMTAEIANCWKPVGCEAREFWRNQPEDDVFSDVNNIRWAGDHVLFTATRPNDEYERWFSVAFNGSTRDPILLTTTDGLIEGQNSVALAKDGRTLFYSTNANDIEHRDVWAVPMAGGTPRQVTKGSGIETYPAPLASGSRIAVMYADVRTPQSVALVPAAGGDARIITPVPRNYPTELHVTPEVVWLTAADGVKFSNQLFVPRDMRPGERRPALIFVHGGPRRQMLPGYHYMHVYHMFYAYNQWLANQGYVVLSVNYRSGVGYGRSFQQADSTGRRGNAEYRDVLAAGKYLQSRPDVDPARVGIWGLSYGGILTAQALARNSDIFIAGADWAGVHLWGAAEDANSVAFRSSSISEIGRWKSPVFLVHGDDDRNVAFSQTVGLVQLLRAHGVYHELIVLPDDPHETLLHSRFMAIFDRQDEFLKRFVWNKEVAANGR
jgi:dipeptidyl aminopeptidase/acylaminoacyl peptidase